MLWVPPAPQDSVRHLLLALPQRCSSSTRLPDIRWTPQSVRSGRCFLPHPTLIAGKNAVFYIDKRFKRFFVRCIIESYKRICNFCNSSRLAGSGRIIASLNSVYLSSNNKLFYSFPYLIPNYIYFFLFTRKIYKNWIVFFLVSESNRILSRFWLIETGQTFPLLAGLVHESLQSIIFICKKHPAALYFRIIQIIYSKLS